MANIERQVENSPNDIVEILALFKAGIIRRENLSKEDDFTLSYYLGLLPDSRQFAAQVEKRVQEITLGKQNGKRVGLYTDQELELAKKHRKKRRCKGVRVSQPRLWEDQVSETNTVWEVYDPLKKLFEVGAEYDDTYRRAKNKLLGEQDKMAVKVLRERIEIPVARGKDPHRGDKFYKYLVKWEYRNDVFGIFGDFLGVVGKESEEITAKIEKVAALNNELLHGEPNLRERYKRFREFVNQYRGEYGMEIHPTFI